MEADRDLDIRVAREVLGKKPCEFSIKARFSAWATMWGCNCPTTEKCYPANREVIDDAHSPLAKYSLQLEAAWDVLLSPESRFTFARGLSSQGGEDFRLCLNYPERDTYWLEYMTPGGLKKGPDAKTPALAICLAALEAVQMERPCSPSR